ncbi:MAG: Ig-like domain-containing protein [Prevotella sp.]|nr:Ig-like domain-containing protein [Prevotella sp.]
MNSHTTTLRTLHLAAVAALLLMLSACARMGNPDGGWFDEQPPRVVGSMPKEQSIGIGNKKITIFFDEYIKLDNPSEKVVISPPQLEQADIRTHGKRITVELKDSLKPNTTYTVDFSDAISDNNEGNPMGNYTFTFSTGDHIDTLEVGGTVLEAENLEPIKGILVGLYDIGDGSSDFSATDTLLRSAPMQRVSRTDSRGRFHVKGVAPGRYRVFALQDVDANYVWNAKSEKVAFLHTVVVPTSKPDVRQDTLWRDSLHIADIVQTGYTHFLPDDLVLRAFTEKQTDRYYIKSERTEANNFKIYFSYGHEKLPRIRPLDFDSTSTIIVEPTVNQDTITYWLADTALVNRDTLTVEMNYFANDTTGVLREHTDTLTLLSKQPYSRRLKQQQEAFEKWQKQQERRRKRGQPVQESMPAPDLKMEYMVPSGLDPDHNLAFKSPTPLVKADTAAIHLYQKIDTLWYRAHYLFGEKPGYPRNYQLISEWQPGSEYSLEIDSAAFVDIYGTASRAYKQGFKVRSTDEYATVVITLSGMNGKNAVVELLSQSDKPVKKTTAEGGVATFYYVKPGTYYMRMFVDENNNGLWDTGSYTELRQPEPCYYYPGKLECRAKWDLRQTWDPTAKPLDRQKPSEILQQKGEQQRKIRQRNADRARSMGVEYKPKQ